MSPLQNMPHTSAMNYWQSFLHDLRPCHFPNPLEEPRPEDESASFQETAVALPLSDQDVREFCSQRQLTPCSVFQAVWAILINRYAGVEDVCFGYDAGDGEISPAMPDCDRILICRANITPENSLRETIWSMMRHFNDATTYGKCSIEEAQKLLGLQDKPLFNSGMRIQKQGRHKRNLNEFDIVAQIMMHDDASLAISVRMRSSYCSAASTARVAHTFAKTLLETLRAHPESLVGDLDIVSQRDYDQIMEWNKVIPQSVETTFHGHFEDIAQQMPDNPAICSWNGNFTYRELDTLSTRLAHRLADLRVGLETLVLICFDKSAYAIVSMLGIMKASCAFVAIDPSYPASRIQAILRATKATIVVAEPAHEHLFQDAVAHVVKLDAQSAEELPLTPATVASRPSASPSNLAYVVFTSGSTGSPKGIQVEHRALCTAARHLATPMRIHSSTRHLNFAAFTFDLSYGDIFVTLAQGACLCLPSEEERINDLAGAIVRMEVSSACLVPSVARILRPEDVPRLQTLSLGGEALVQENLTLWAPRVTLNNMYGPSECTIWCCSNMGLKANSAANNIGRGVGALIWITSPNNHDHLCPIGCIGELLIEGPVMARGYLDAEQTLGSFVENPSWAMAESRTRRRFYKTGDLVRYNPDGTVSFMGRKDTQVKVHGRRIELGEIEYQLASHDALRQSMVILPSTGIFASRLVAVMVLKSIPAIQETMHELHAVTGRAKEQSVAEIAKIKAFLAPRVPHYMLPQYWVVVEAIPLMISGKMNRVLVKRFVESQTKDSSDVVRVNGVTTRPPVEDLMGQRLREIWSQVMNYPLVDLGLDQSFESLGGDSFSAMELVARCKTAGIVLTVQDLQSSSTIREVASMAKLRSSGSWNADATSDTARTRNTHSTLRPALTVPPIWWNTQPAVVS